MMRTSVLLVLFASARLSAQAGPAATAGASSMVGLQRQLAAIDDSMKAVSETITGLDSYIFAIDTGLLKLRSVKRPEFDSVLSALRVTVTGDLSGPDGERAASLLLRLSNVFEPLADSALAAVSFDMDAVTDAVSAVLDVSEAAPFNYVELVPVTGGRRRSLRRRLVDRDFEAIASFLTATAFEQKRDSVKGTLETLRKRYAEERQDKTSEREGLEKRANEILSRIAEKESAGTKIDITLITYAMPIFAGTFLLLLVLPRIYKNRDVDRAVFESPILLELITVFLLATTVLMLGMGGKLTGEVLGTLLGGISGYVLGRTRNGEPGRHAAQSRGSITVPQPQPEPGD